MCGICGAVDRAGPVDRDVLERMTRSLAHRGPDDEGLWVSPPREGASCSAGLGFRRLSIIDVAGGNQPIWNEDGTVAVIFNGEIYNFRELRAVLEARGHCFSTATDTEVIVHLYEDLGADCVTRLNGMFALAVWDTRDETLFLARDRLGEKPLYYAEAGSTFLFGSEPKALLQHPACPHALDHNALAQYLALDYVPAPDSIFSGMRKLEAAHRLVLRGGHARIDRYWELPFEPDPARSEADWADELRTRLEEAVRLRLVSDVPLGVFLSGGIDSSTVVALMARHVPAAELKTFSIGFGERSFDESDHARRVATLFGTDHHEHVFTPQVMLDVLPRVLAGVDEPFADSSVLPTFVLSEFTRGTVTVALGGDGGDELLAGYPTFQADAIARRYLMPRALHERAVVPLAQRLPVSTDNFSFDFKLKRFLRGARLPTPDRHGAWLGGFTAAGAQRVLREPPAIHPHERLRAVDHGSAGLDPVARLIRLYALTYLADDILVKTDRASMLTSLEVRAPFLDHTLVEFLGRVPSNLKLHRYTTKHLLKRAVRDLLPREIAERPKKGFGIPLAAWLKRELREPLLDELSPERLQRQGLFEPAEVARLVGEHLNGRRDNRKELWALYAFQLWHRSYASV